MLKLFTFPKKLFLYIHRRKYLSIPCYLFLAFILYVIILIQISGDTKYSKVLKGNYINDVTRLNPIKVNKIIRPTDSKEIKEAIVSTMGAISIGGGKFSMGGQTAFNDSLHIDMRSFNKVIHLDIKKKEVTVQAGITWRALQEVIDKENLSIKIMQTYANFTVGGSISVNCHGRYIGYGPIVSSVKSMKIMLVSGEEIVVSRNENYDVFKAVVGGYGGMGVILEATLELVDNIKVERETHLVDVKEYRQFFEKEIAHNKDVIFQNGDLYPPYYDKVMNVAWKKSSKPLTNEERITLKEEDYWLEQRLVDVVSWGDTGKWLRRTIIDPYIYSSDAVVWRNKEASYDVKELEPSSREETTYVLNEYFIPVKSFESFIPKMRAIYEKYDVNILNVSLRHALTDKETYLSWAHEEVFAFVVYYKQETSKEARKNVKEWTKEMTDAILSEGGTWYLPYQPHASLEQFQKGYPEYQKYFDIKEKLDPHYRLTNKLLDKYNPKTHKEIENTIKGYYRAAEQTVLTVPEWYLVFNPKEYADYLESGKNPSSFPFYASINEYWKLYDRSVKLVENYPKNDEYMTMLQVIGVSTTIEYGFKMLYENTIGKIFSWFSEPTLSTQEQIIYEAHRAYSDFVYQTAFYEFSFWSWVTKVWESSETQTQYSSIRKWERTLFFTMEFSFKAFYSQLLASVAKATYEEPVKEIYVWVTTTEEIEENENLKIIQKDHDKYLLAIRRWGTFTKELITLSHDEMTINTIGANHQIVISLLVPKTEKAFQNNAEYLYDSAIVSNDKIKRVVSLVPVDKMLEYIKNCLSRQCVVEHIYDY